MAIAVLDVNLLLYAYDAGAPRHQAARKWLESTLSGDAPVGLPMLTITAFLRIMTNHKFTHVQMRMSGAIDAVEEILALPNVRVLHTDGEHWRILRKVLSESGVTGRTVTDAQFAALTIQHGGTLYTTDRHFARFPGLRWTNPLDPVR